MTKSLLSDRQLPYKNLDSSNESVQDRDYELLLHHHRPLLKGLGQSSLQVYLRLLYLRVNP